MGAVLLGVLINKASIPSARVVFSDVCLLTSRNGEPVLILRIGNTRGNFLLNPEIRVGYLKVLASIACNACASWNTERMSIHCNTVRSATYSGWIVQDSSSHAILYL